jgi:HAD superfamily hydrolase (TIGR01509 family)
MALVKRGGLPLRPGVARLINEARAVGVRLAIATTTSPENVTTLLTSTLGSDAVDWFDVIAAGDMVEAKKPAPDIYHCALEELKLPPSSCIAFEDSANGIRSAKGAGLTTVITPCDYTRDDDFSGADLIVDQLGEPESPCRLFAGSLYGRQMVDLALLGALLGSR